MDTLGKEELIVEIGKHFQCLIDVNGTQLFALEEVDGALEYATTNGGGSRERERESPNLFMNGSCCLFLNVSHTRSLSLLHLSLVSRQQTVFSHAPFLHHSRVYVSPISLGLYLCPLSPSLYSLSLSLIFLAHTR